MRALARHTSIPLAAANASTGDAATAAPATSATAGPHARRGAHARARRAESTAVATKERTPRSFSARAAVRDGSAAKASTYAAAATTAQSGDVHPVAGTFVSYASPSPLRSASP